MDKVRNIIYKAKNEVRKCFYIGYSIRGLSNRKRSHKSDAFKRKLKHKLYRFIRKYGWDSFTWEVLAVYSTKEELPQAEIDWLKKQKEEFVDWECLNLTNGGDGNLGWEPSLKAKINMSKNHANVSNSNNPMFGTSGGFCGKRHSEETKNLQSLHSPKYWFGKTLSEEHRKNMSIAHKGQTPWNKGKPMEKEAKLRMIESKKKRNKL